MFPRQHVRIYEENFFCINHERYSFVIKLYIPDKLSYFDELKNCIFVIKITILVPESEFALIFKPIDKLGKLVHMRIGTHRVYSFLKIIVRYLTFYVQVVLLESLRTASTLEYLLKVN